MSPVLRNTLAADSWNHLPYWLLPSLLGGEFLYRFNSVQVVLPCELSCWYSFWRPSHCQGFFLKSSILAKILFQNFWWLFSMTPTRKNYCTWTFFIKLNTLYEHTNTTCTVAAVTWWDYSNWITVILLFIMHIEAETTFWRLGTRLHYLLNSFRLSYQLSIMLCKQGLYINMNFLHFIGVGETHHFK